MISDRPNTFLEHSGSYNDFFKLFLVRLAYFFSVWVDGYSFSHNVLSSITIILFVFSVFLYLFNNPNNFSEYQSKVLFYALLFILMGGIYHSATVIDHDWRYRFPYIPLMSIFIVTMIDHLISSIKKTENI